MNRYLDFFKSTTDYLSNFLNQHLVLFSNSYFLLKWFVCCSLINLTKKEVNRMLLKVWVEVGTV